MNYEPCADVDEPPTQPVDQLPATGTTTTTAVWAAVLLVAAGVALSAVSRRSAA